MSGRTSEAALLTLLSGLLCLEALRDDSALSAAIWAVAAIFWFVTTGARLAEREGGAS
jgi:hypothetical protein